MSDEVSGTSAFKFMHKDDVRWTIVALRDSKFYSFINLELLSIDKVKNKMKILSFQCTIMVKIMDHRATDLKRKMVNLFT